MTARRIRCVGGLVYDPQGRLLLVQRANPPARGSWSIPGGRVEPGEDDESAVVRELAEETGLTVRVDRYVGSVERPTADGDAPAAVFVIHDYACTVVGGSLRAGDDALAAGWFAAVDLAGLPTSPGLVEALSSWGALPS